MLKAAVVQVLVSSKVAANVDVHFDLGVSAVRQSVYVWPLMCDIVWEQRALVEVSSLVDVFVRRRVELDHYCAIHLRSCDIHRRRIDIIQCRHPCTGVALWRTRPRSVNLEHVLLVGIIGAIVHMLLQ